MFKFKKQISLEGVEKDMKMMKKEIGLHPANKEHFNRLIPFAQEIVNLCQKNDIKPILYGSFAHFYYTQDSSLNVNDIDLLISRKEFSRIYPILKKDCKYEIILDGKTIVVKNKDLIVELDEVETNPRENEDTLKKINFYGTEMKIIRLNQLELIYPLAFIESTRNKGKVLEKIISLEKFLGRDIGRFNMKNKEVCLEIYKTFSEEREVIAILNNGSSAIGKDKEGSDIDFLIIVRDKEGIERIRRIFRKKYKILKNEESPEIEVEEQYGVLGKRVDPTIIPKEEIEKKVKTFYNSKENFLSLQHFIKHKIVDSVAIYDKEKLVEGWKKEVESYPRKIMREVFDSQIKSIKENLFYWKNHKFRNEFQFGFEQWELIQSICQALYAKNKQMFMLPYKRLSSDLKELKPDIEKEMYKLIRGRNTPKAIQEKVKIVEKILQRLEK